MVATSRLPGWQAPAVGFEQPFEMLEACHERVQRMLALLRNLCDYLHRHPCDDSARQAARDVLRYFDMTAPLHHEDEELHVFPALLARGVPATVALVQQLQQEHCTLAADWAWLRGPLQALATGEAQGFGAQDEQAFRDFTALYARHIAQEEQIAYPQARALLPAPIQAAMGMEMAGRRGAVRAPG